MNSKKPTPDIPKAPQLEEAKQELEMIAARAEAIQQEINKLQAEYSQINLRAAFLQGVIQASTKKAK